MKEVVRSLVRRTGFDIVPFDAARLGLITRLLNSEAIDLLVDVGASRGQYGRKMRALGYRGEMFSIEPAREPFRILERSASIDPRWTALRCALGSSEGSMQLNLSRNSVSSSLLQIESLHVDIDPESAVVGEETVDVRRLDDVLSGRIASRIWLKVDVQGYERVVLDGATQNLARVSVLEMEISLRRLYDGGVSYIEMLSLCERAGFTPISFEPAFVDPHSGETLQMDVLFARRDR